MIMIVVEVLRLFAVYAMWPAFILGVLWAFNLEPKLNITLLDKIGPALSSYGLGTVLPWAFSQKDLRDKLGSRTEETPGGAITIYLPSAAKYRNIKTIVQALFFGGMLVWLCTLFFSARTAVGGNSFSFYVPLAGASYFVAVGIISVYLRYGAPEF